MSRVLTISLLFLGLSISSLEAKPLNLGRRVYEPSWEGPKHEWQKKRFTQRAFSKKESAYLRFNKPEPRRQTPKKSQEEAVELRLGQINKYQFRSDRASDPVAPRQRAGEKASAYRGSSGL